MLRGWVDSYTLAQAASGKQAKGCESSELRCVLAGQWWHMPLIPALGEAEAGRF